MAGPKKHREPLDRPVHVRVTSSMWKDIEADARKRGLTASDVVRTRLMAPLDMAIKQIVTSEQVACSEQ